MKIKNRITYNFTFSVASILILFSTAIYFFSAEYREDQFYSRLKYKAKTTAKLLIEIEQVDSVLLILIDRADQTIMHQEKVLIFNENYEKIYDSREEITLDIDTSLINRIKKTNEIKYSDNGKEIIGITYSDHKNNFIVIASAYDIYGYRKLKNLTNVLITGLLASIVIIFILGRNFADKFLKPISDVVNQVDDISVNNLNVRVYGGNNNDEIAYLAFIFNKMLERLETAFEMQKSFVSNASHELRTPFTSIIGQIDVALLKKRDIAEYNNILISIKEDIRNLIDLTNRLLLLAQTSIEFPVASFVLCRVDEILWQSRSELIKRFDNYNINIYYKKTPDDESILKLKANDQLIKIAFINLMDNACKFSPDSEVNVEIDYDDKNVIVRFIDKGTGIPEEEKNRIFEPFYRASANINIAGHGIGLPLVENIIKIHKGSIEFSSIPGKETIFVVNIPKFRIADL